MLEAAAVAACILAALVLAPILGPAALALATSLMYLGLSWAGIVLLKHRFLKSKLWVGVLPALARTLGCGLVMAGAVSTSRFMLGQNASGALVTLVIPSIAGGIVYLGLAKIVLREDLNDLLGSIRKALVSRSSQMPGAIEPIKIAISPGNSEAGGP